MTEFEIAIMPYRITFVTEINPARSFDDLFALHGKSKEVLPVIKYTFHRPQLPEDKAYADIKYHLVHVHFAASPSVFQAPVIQTLLNEYEVALYKIPETNKLYVSTKWGTISLFTGIGRIDGFTFRLKHVPQKSETEITIFSKFTFLERHDYWTRIFIAGLPIDASNSDKEDVDNQFWLCCQIIKETALSLSLMDFMD
jgi:hypothetical protein